MATDFAVKVVKIKEVVDHPGADRLSLALIDGWQCIIQRGQYHSGDLAVYIPIDSILTPDLEAKLFGPDAKIKLSKSRVKTIKIRGSISQGMLAPCNDLGVPAIEGYDCTKQLGITKFEPPVNLSVKGGNPVSKKKKNPHFKEYGGLDNFKYYPDLFTEGDEVVITEKVHGTNFRAGYVPTHVDSFWKKVTNWFGLLPKYEFVYGSNKVQLQNKKYKGYYDKKGAGNVYEEAVDNNMLRESLRPGQVVYGEIYGSGVQKNYEYGCKEGQRKLVIFDLMVDGEYIDTDQLQDWCDVLGYDMVPVLYRGPFSAAKAKELTLGNSVMVPTQKVREGVVIKPVHETKCHMGRKVLKLISDAYLLDDDNTDFH